jgi:hypothetical protein
MSDRRIAVIDQQIIQLKREREALVWMKEERKRLNQDCHTFHEEFNGYKMFFSP